VALGGPRSGEIPNLNGSPGWPPLDPNRAKSGYLGYTPGAERWACNPGERQGLQEQSAPLAAHWPAAGPSEAREPAPCRIDKDFKDLKVSQHPHPF